MPSADHTTADGFQLGTVVLCWHAQPGKFKMQLPYHVVLDGAADRSVVPGGGAVVPVVRDDDTVIREPQAGAGGVDMADQSAAEVQRKAAQSDQALPEGSRVLVQGYGVGTYRRFGKKTLGANDHTIDFDENTVGTKTIKLRNREWSLLAEHEAASGADSGDADSGDAAGEAAVKQAAAPSGKFHVAEALRFNGQFEQAIRYYTDALVEGNDHEINRVTNAMIHNNRAACYTELANQERALADYSMAVSWEDTPLYRCNRAAVYSALGLVGQARLDLSAALKLDPSYQDAKDMLAGVPAVDPPAPAPAPAPAKGHKGPVAAVARPAPARAATSTQLTVAHKRPGGGAPLLDEYEDECSESDVELDDDDEEDEQNDDQDFEGGCGDCCPELQTGLELMQRGRWQEAKRILFSAATGCQTMQKKAHLLGVTCLMRLQDYAEALPYLDGMLEASCTCNSYRTRALLVRSVVHRKLGGHSAEAADDVEEALDTAMLHFAAEIFLEVSPFAAEVGMEFHEAVEVADSVINGAQTGYDLDKAATLSFMTHMLPEQRGAWRASAAADLGDSMRAVLQPAAAICAYTAALAATRTGGVVLSPAVGFDAHFRRAQCRIELGEWEAALEDLHICVKRDPESGKAWYGMALTVHAANMDYPQA